MESLQHMEYDLLYKVNSPADLKQLSLSELPQYCRELRQYIIEECSKNPGHLASSLGVVELTVALHYVYDVPMDKLVWDVGHQAYAHKIITERRDLFPTNRMMGGISGFPRMAESKYDTFGAGHSSTSISAAFGLVKAAELRGEKSHVVAIIGDGAMTGGLAFEGLNNAGDKSDKKSNILVILNDNEMAIDQATGALKSYLTRVSTSQHYNRIKRRLWRIFAHVPSLLRFCQKVGNAIKQGLLQNSNLFESLNFRYFGQVDGHDVNELVRILKALKDINEPKLLHIITTKGKGYTPAEDNQSVWHAPGRFNPETGERIPSKDSASRYQDVFGETLLELARKNDKIVGVTPAMPSGCSMNILMREIPERCFDVGIAEGHAVTFSAGLAAGGMHPVCNIYSSFMQRAYDNVIHDVALQNLPVTFCLDRGGLVGEDGATHHGVFDLAYFSCVPNMIVASPMNELELRNMLYSAIETPTPYAIRYPRGCGMGVEWKGKPFEMIATGKGRVIKSGDDVAVLTIGPVGNFASEAISRVEAAGKATVAHYDMRFAKPLDEELLHEVGKKFQRVITVEDGVLRGGVGEAIVKFFNDNGYSPKVKNLGIEDRFIEHGTPAQLYALCGYDVDGIEKTINSML
ncbi:MAG: 1-deoxy-D-xylulose-5-phosphate synthase [Alistipes sp.]|nr:1-deoxy-D-xylulose-5-phosphate synthase [Alistipes sp.]